MNPANNNTSAGRGQLQPPVSSLAALDSADGGVASSAAATPVDRPVSPVAGLAAMTSFGSPRLAGSALQAQLLHRFVSMNPEAAEHPIPEADIKRWVDDAPPDQRAIRHAIGDTILACWRDPQTQSLAFDYGPGMAVNVSSLPPLPPHLTEINLSGLSKLIQLPDLSSCRELERLDLEGCAQLHTLPDFRQFPNLQELTLSGCSSLQQPPVISGLKALAKLRMNECTSLTQPPDLSGCDGLQEFMMSSCAITEPPVLADCKNLHTLWLDECPHLRAYPALDHTPGLVSCALGGCPQVVVPPDLRGCPELELLSLSDCASLRSAPDLSRCGKLQYVAMDNCPSLTVPPLLGEAHSEMEELTLLGTPLRSLPEHLLALPRDCVVQFCAGMLPPAIISLLDGVIQAQNYTGPQVTYLLDPPRPLSVLPLAQEIAAWRRQGSRAEGDDPEWHQALMEDGAEAVTAAESAAESLSTWLNRLRETSEYQNPTTRERLVQRVNDLLDAAAQPEPVSGAQELRKLLLNHAQDALGTCGDRIALGLLKMEKSVFQHQIELAVQAGEYDSQPAKLAELGIAMHRLDQLEQIASEKVAALNFADETEVHLGYLVALAREFALPVNMDTMLYGSHSQITHQDLEAARARLSNLGLSVQDGSALAFVSAWGPMQSLIGRLREQRPDLNIPSESEIEDAVEARHTEIYKRLEALMAEDPEANRQKIDQLPVEYHRAQAKTRSAMLAGFLLPLLEQATQLQGKEHRLDRSSL